MTSLICQNCGIEAPTRHVAFYRNIGLLIMRMQASCQGDLCKRCIHRRFWSFTLVNLTLGWWGVISLIVTPVFVLNNLVRYIGCLGMPAPGPDAAKPQLTEAQATMLNPYASQILERLNQQEDLRAVAADIGSRVRISPATVILYTQALIQSIRTSQQEANPAADPPAAPT